MVRFSASALLSLGAKVSRLSSGVDLSRLVAAESTVPVITVGVGVGIDYAVYFMDRIREEFAHSRDIHKAVINAVATTGYAVSFTATTLIAGVILWIFMSSLRFQSDTAVLLSFMLIVNAIAAMFIVPAWCVVFKPHFVTHTEVDADGVIQEKV